MEQLKDDVCEFNLKELNEQAEQRRLAGANVKNFRTLIYYYTIKKYIQKMNGKLHRQYKYCRLSALKN